MIGNRLRQHLLVAATIGVVAVLAILSFTALGNRWLAGAVAIATVIGYGILWWSVGRRQAWRIAEITRQAEKLRNADFGERLPSGGGDALDELVEMFNDMRDRLRNTTMSRNYVDSILANMNDAIIVTGEDGVIKLTNRAALQLLGYEDDELDERPVDTIVDRNRTGSLLAFPPSGVPREAWFRTKYGESIPVSYTSSTLDNPDDGPRDRVFAAQNITERRRAEKRIRYLARIDPLTKVPNRMQFQHLLQRSIARARRAEQSVCLLYLDIDHFKDINDTFGHLAGDTTLETVAERLAAALPENSVIGRLAGDEFAVVVDSDPADRMTRVDIESLARRRVRGPDRRRHSGHRKPPQCRCPGEAPARPPRRPVLRPGPRSVHDGEHGDRLLPGRCIQCHRPDPQRRRGALSLEALGRERLLVVLADDERGRGRAADDQEQAQTRFRAR